MPAAPKSSSASSSGAGNSRGSSSSTDIHSEMYVGSDKQTIYQKGRESPVGRFLPWGDASQGMRHAIAAGCFQHKNCKRSYSDDPSSYSSAKGLDTSSCKLCPPA